MKRILTILALSVCVAASADEGMWLLPLLQKFNSEAMRNIGCRLSAEDIYSINKTSLKDAIVQFGGGCTGEIISDEGLLVTNHHCGYSSIQCLSTPEHNYLEDGFWALNKDMELPVPGLTVTFMRSMQDVTSAFKSVKTPEGFEAKRHEIEAAAEKDNPCCKARVTSFYNDNVFYLIVYKIYKDVRFVATPPAALGKFGGETDNWMWPRHTCDFSMFRVYAGPDNQPAEYSPENRPLKPARSLKVSLKGVKEGDFTFIMGYPGRTQRFQTAAQLRMMLARNRVSIDARTVRQGVMWEEMEKDPAVRLQYANKYAGSANGWKKWQGEELAFANLDIIGREEKREAELEKWIEAKSSRKKAYGGAIAEIEAAIAEETPLITSLTLLYETLGNIEVLNSRRRDKDYNAEVDRRISKALIAHYLERVTPEDRISCVSAGEDYLDRLYGEDPAAREELSKAIEDRFSLLAPKLRSCTEKISAASRRFTASLLDWEKGKASYPDANFTMRLTYGQVLPYSPKDGVSYWYWTTTDGLLQKEDPKNYEFRLPEQVKAPILAKDFGRWADSADGKLHCCFLSNNDITGGNSGSPIMDADGNLIGLAFDGNWESMSSDVCFEPDLQRCINVDIRYVLWMVEKVGGASNLIDEIQFVE